MKRQYMYWLLSLVGILAILYTFTKTPSLEGFQDSPASVPLSTLQTMFASAGCTRILTEADVWWWRKQPNIDDVKIDMNAYADIAKTCKGTQFQHDFCIPNRCVCE